MDASIPMQEIVTSTCTLLSVCTCTKCATFADLVASRMSKIVVQAMWWLGYLVPEMCKRIYNANCKPTCWATQCKMRESHSIQYKLRGNHSICANSMPTIRYAYTIFESWIKGNWAIIRTTCYVNIIVCKSHFRESKWISSCEFRNSRPKRP